MAVLVENGKGTFCSRVIFVPYYTERRTVWMGQYGTKFGTVGACRSLSLPPVFSPQSTVHLADLHMLRCAGRLIKMSRQSFYSIMRLLSEPIRVPAHNRMPRSTSSSKKVNSFWTLARGVDYRYAECNRVFGQTLLLALTMGLDSLCRTNRVGHWRGPWNFLQSGQHCRALQWNGRLLGVLEKAVLTAAGVGT